LEAINFSNDERKEKSHHFERREEGLRGDRAVGRSENSKA
jgi:hypothetical protein